ncbi:acyl-CoA carboxylase subunit epsilon [Curtobacterium ammoniigenes]|uniref:acyl-CoA carboxylase subunit epsilon n=1 Tax=Curtobacterium ammoniigenes TaxID=395387 RepID=UPI00082CA17B|nr:acyl-CoA carboxylase subunit epsilon [Curtobacterium ammoniigenes]
MSTPPLPELESHDAGLRVVAGSPTPDELAAVIAVLQAAQLAWESERHTVDDGDARAAWNASARGLRRPLPVGPHAWVHSFRSA